MITLTNISKRYTHNAEHIDVLSNVNLRINKGESVCLRGPSGTGKTTLLNIIGGMLAPSAGAVEVNGHRLTGMPQHFLASYRREHIGFIFQHFNLLEHWTVMENLQMPLVPSGQALKQHEKGLLALMVRLQIDHRKDFRANCLSGGEQQRVGVARALVNDPDIILADEPFSNLDRKNTDFIIELFLELKRAGKTFILTSTSGASGREKGFVDRDIHHDDYQ